MLGSDAAWLAGFIDGEGHVGMHPNGRSWMQANVFVRHTHRPTVDHVVRLLSQLEIDIPITCEIRGLQHKDSYRVNVTGMARILRLADVVEPFSVTKVEQWAVLRQWCESRLTASRHGGYTDGEWAIAATGCAMNRRGKGS